MSTENLLLSTAPRSLWSNAARYLFRQRSAVVGMFILGILLFCAIMAPVLATHNPEATLIGKEDVKKLTRGSLYSFLRLRSRQTRTLLWVGWQSPRPL